MSHFKGRYFRFDEGNKDELQIHFIDHFNLNESLQHTQSHNCKENKNFTEWINYILDTLSTEYTNKHLLNPLDISPYVINACDQSCIMIIMLIMLTTVAPFINMV